MKGLRRAARQQSPADNRLAANTWTMVVHEWEKSSGERLTRQRAQQIAKRAIAKLRIALAEDRVIREWLEHQGIPITPDDPAQH